MKKEMNELFGFGKRKKEYPATELTTILNVLISVAKKNGINLNANQREKLVNELEKALNDVGYVVNEQKLMLGTDIELKVDAESMPVLTALLSKLSIKNPNILKGIPALFKRGAINLDLSKLERPKVSFDEPEEDLAATIKTEPATGEPEEDLAATIKTEPVSMPAASDEKNNKIYVISQEDISKFALRAGLDRKPKVLKKMVDVLEQGGFTIAEQKTIKHWKLLAGIK